MTEHGSNLPPSMAKGLAEFRATRQQPTQSPPSREQEAPDSSKSFIQRISLLHAAGASAVASGAVLLAVNFGDRLPFFASPASASEPPVPTLAAVADCDPAYVNGQNWSNVRMHITDSTDTPVDPHTLGTKTKIQNPEGQTVVIGTTAPGQPYGEIHLNTYAIAAVPPEEPKEATSMFLKPHVEHTIWVEADGKKLAETTVRAEENCHTYDNPQALKVAPTIEAEHSDADVMTISPVEKVSPQIFTTTGSHAE